MSTATNSFQTRQARFDRIWLVASGSAIAFAFLKLTYDASVVAVTSSEDLILVGLMFGAGARFLVSFIRGIASPQRLAVAKVVAAIVGFALLGYSLIPPVEKNVARNREEIVALAKSISEGKAVMWPIRVGPFEFISGADTSVGVMLHTTASSEGDVGLVWTGTADSNSHLPKVLGNPVMAGVGKDLFVYRR